MAVRQSGSSLLMHGAGTVGNGAGFRDGDAHGAAAVGDGGTAGPRGAGDMGALLLSARATDPKGTGGCG